MGTSVHLAATVASTSERASGLARSGDELNITVTHRNSRDPVRLRIKAHTFSDGSMRLSLREVYPSGNTRLIDRFDVGRPDGYCSDDAIDLTELAPRPTPRNT